MTLMENTTNNEPIAVSYIRVFDKENIKNPMCVEYQKNVISSYAAKNKLNIKYEFIDIEATENTSRNSFYKMLSFLNDIRDYSKDSRIIVITERTDRLYSTVAEHKAIDEHNVEVHIVKEEQVISRQSKASDRLVHGLRILMLAEYVHKSRL